MRSFVIMLLLAVILGLGVLFPHPQPGPMVPAGLPPVRVAVLYEWVTDGGPTGRSLEEVIAILKEVHTQLIFRGFWRWSPCPNRCEDLPTWQARERCRLRGYSYTYLEEAIAQIKAEMPDVIFVGAVPAQIVQREAIWNPKTGEVIEYPETWELALDPAKWGLPMSKEEFQCRFGKTHLWVPQGLDCSLYDPEEAVAYFPDITYPKFQELLLSWAERQIDAGADAIWIDMLFKQAGMLARLAGDMDHPAVRESYEAIHRIVDRIHNYGAARGRQVYVGSWGMVMFPYPPPALDFVTTTPTAQEVREMRLDEARWDERVVAIRERYGEVPILAFIDWASTTETPLGQFSQLLSPEEQREFLRLADEFFAERDVVFVYPVYGGWMGNDAEILSFGLSRVYDSLAPEFDTYGTIVELAQGKAAALAGARTLSQVEVAAQYRYLTDGAPIGRSLEEAIALLKGLGTDFIFQGWVTEWQPLVERCADLPTLGLRAKCERAGYSYAHLAEAVRQAKEVMPQVIFGGGLLVEFLYPDTIDPVTGERLDRERAWALALDPTKWGLSLTKEDFHKLIAANVYHWTDDPEHYNPREEMRAFFPDITDPQFQELFLHLAEKQIDVGVDALWIDGLFAQAKFFKDYAARHPRETERALQAAQEAYEASLCIVDWIHEYGQATRGQSVYILSWPDSIEFPYPQPQLDGIMTSLRASEILAGRLDEARWDDLLAQIRAKFPGAPIFARIDYGEHDRTPLAVFSQRLSPEEQRGFLRTADRFLAERGVLFIYPVHGGYMGPGARRLAFGRSPFYDSLAPEFNTYGTIMELAQARAGESEVPEPYRGTYAALEATLEEFERYLDGVWAGEPYPVAFGANLLPANLNAGEAMLEPAYYERTLHYLDALQALGVRLIHLDIGYPLLSQDFPRSEEYLALYRRLAEEIRARGLKLHVEFAFALPEWVPLSYEGFTKERVRRVLLEYAELICRELQPDYYTIVDEPHTQNERLGLEISIPEWTEFVSYVYAETRRNCAGVRIGAGGGTWEEPFVRSFAQNTEVDFLNLHLYGLHNGLHKLVELAGFVHARGKGVGIGEAWAHYGGQDWLKDKWRYSDVFSFWAPLDARFLRILAKLAHWQELEFVDPFFTGYFFAYLDYEEVRQNPGEYMPPNRMLWLALERAMEAAAAGQLTETGRAYQAAIALGVSEGERGGH